MAKINKANSSKKNEEKKEVVVKIIQPTIIETKEKIFTCSEIIKEQRIEGSNKSFLLSKYKTQSYTAKEWEMVFKKERMI